MVIGNSNAVKRHCENIANQKRTQLYKKFGNISYFISSYKSNFLKSIFNNTINKFDYKNFFAISSQDKKKYPLRYYSIDNMLYDV